MNDMIALKTLEDHKYLLIEVQNRAAIAFFAAANRNLSLYSALKKHMDYENEIIETENEDSSLDDDSDDNKTPGATPTPAATQGGATARSNINTARGEAMATN